MNAYIFSNKTSLFSLTKWPVLIALALLSTGLMFYCYQALSKVFPLPLLAFVPILIALQLAPTLKKAIVTALVGSISFGLLTLHGFENYGFGPYLAAACFLGSQYFFYFIFFIYLRSAAYSVLAKAVLSATVYIAIDYLYSNLQFAPTGRYAATLSYDQHFVQIVQLTGPAGLSFALIFANTAIAAAIADLKKIRNYSRDIAIVSALFLAVYAYGHFVLAAPEADASEIDFAIIQGGITKQQYDAMPDDYSAWALVRDRYFEMTREAHALGYRNIIWPETAIRSYVGVKQDLVRLQQSLGQPLLGGFPLLLEDSGVQFNSALQLDENAEIVGRYDKNNLLPFAESEFLPGKDALPMTATFQKTVADKQVAESVVVSTPICLEVLFPGFVRQLTSKGAELIIVLTNDAGFGFTAISALVQKQAVLRAVENNRYLIRVAQSGISSLISNRGAVEVQTQVMQQKIVPVTARLQQQHTVYAKFGEWFLVSMLAVSALIVLRNRSRGY